MKRRAFVAAAVAAAGWLGGCARTGLDARPGAPRWRSTLYRDHELAGTVWNVSTGRKVGERTLREAVRAARYRLLGEVHDNPDHHALQLELLDGLSEAGLKPLVAFEQFDADHDAALQALAARGPATAEEIANAVHFNRKGWNWDFYRPLVEVALRHGLPLRAANLSTPVAARVVKDGLATLGPGRTAALRMEKSWSHARERVLRRSIAEGHCGALPEHLVPRMANAQRARDATLAEAIRNAGRDGAVLIAGNGHVRRDLAVPLYLDGPICAVGILEVDAGKARLADYMEDDRLGPEYDFVCFTPRTERPDPCASFKPRACGG